MLRERLDRTGRFDLLLAPLAKAAVIELAHDPAYVRAFFEGTVSPEVMRRIGFPWSEGLVRRTRASVGATMAATRQALRAGWSGALSGGTHHAFWSYGSGFCVFNDVAVALRAWPELRPAAVIDLDVHQGDGTAALFQDDPSVLTLSLHGRNNFPYRKQRSRVDVEFDDRVGDSEYLDKLCDVLPGAFEPSPAIVFYVAGADPLASDRLGKLSLSAAGLRARDELVVGECVRRRIPLVIVLGGGYAEPIEDTVEAHAATFETAASAFSILD